MGELSRGPAQPEFLSTHPSAATRVRQIEGWLPEALSHSVPPRADPTDPQGGIGPLPRDPPGGMGRPPRGYPDPSRKRR